MIQSLFLLLCREYRPSWWSLSQYLFISFLLKILCTCWSSSMSFTLYGHHRWQLYSMVQTTKDFNTGTRSSGFVVMKVRGIHPIICLPFLADFVTCSIKVQSLFSHTPRCFKLDFSTYFITWCISYFLQIFVLAVPDDFKFCTVEGHGIVVSPLVHCLQVLL